MTYNPRMTYSTDGIAQTGWFVAVGANVASAIQDALDHYHELKTFQNLLSFDILG